MNDVMGSSGPEHEPVVSELHDVASELAEMDSQEDVCHRIITAAETLLDFDFSIVAIEEDGRLRPIAVSSGLDPDGFATMSIHRGIAGKTYRTGESYLVEDVTECEEAEPEGSWLSGISLPLGGYGNFQAVDEETSAFDERDLQLAELLTMHASHHLDRISNKERLQRQNDRLKEFASVVSHDLRNPLSVAQGRLELVNAECDSEHIEDVARAHDRMDGLIDDLLTLARAGKSVGNLEVVDLANVTVECWENVATADATLRTDIEGEIHADRSRLKQVLGNLIRNAVEHGGEDVTVTVGTLDDGFYVADDGSGVPEAEREGMFQTGYSTSDEGTGFGLSIVKQVADAHGWDVQVTDSPDGGARFEITGVEFVGE